MTDHVYSARGFNTPTDSQFINFIYDYVVFALCLQHVVQHTVRSRIIGIAQLPLMITDVQRFQWLYDNSSISSPPCPDRVWNPSSVLYNECWDYFHGAKAAEA